MGANVTKCEEVYCTEVETSKTDSNKYLGFVLPNKLKVLIGSNSGAPTAAVAYTLGVGSLMDPPEFPGMAHFCEHMVHLGTEKYPNDDLIREFAGCFGGTRNANTYYDYTNFYFEIADDNLEVSLDRLAQMFIAPLFQGECIQSEVEVIESEFLNSENCNRRKTIQVYDNVNSNGPYTFLLGNKKSLLEDPVKKGLDLQKALRTFHEKWYSSDM